MDSKQMKKKAFAATLAVLFTANVQADTIGLYIGGQSWQSEASGIFGEKNNLIDFNLKKEQQSHYFVAVEHPFPVLPNVRISSTTLDTTGKNNLIKEFSFGDEIFPSGSIESDIDTHTGANVNSTIDVSADASFNVSYVDYTLYYELFDNGAFSFDLGVTARDFNVDISVIGTTTLVTTTDEAEHYGHIHPTTEKTDISQAKGKIKTEEIMTLLYVATNITLPLRGVSVFAQGDFLLIDEHSLYDYQIGLSYDLVDSRMVDFNVNLGYRAVKMELEDLNGLYSELEFKGAFIGVIAHF
jgi:outer membrane protein